MKTLLGFGLSCFAVALSAVGLADVPNLPFVQDGLVLHVDAQDKSSMTLDDDGYVTSWTSSASPDGNPLVLENANTIASTYLPYYKAVGVTGKPCVMFGESVTGAKRATVLGKKDANLGTGSTMGVFTTFIDHGSYDGVFGSLNTTKMWFALYNSNLEISINTVNADKLHLAGVWNSSSFDLIAVDRRDLWNLTDLADTHNTVAYYGPQDRAHIFYANAVVACANPAFGRVHTTQNYYSRCEVNEWLYYNRTLTPFERAVNECCLSAKWFDRRITTWVGGASGDWHTAANWSNGVPDAGTAAVVPVSAAITISSPASVADFVVASTVGGSLTVNADLTVCKGFGVPGNYTLTFGNGVTLALMNDRGVTLFPANVTMGATFKKTGPGDIRLAGAIAGVPAVTLEEGGLYLDGHSQTFATLAGDGLVTNASTTRATLTLTANGAAQLGTGLGGAIDVDASAVPDTVTVRAANAPQGSLALGAETVVSKAVNPASIPDCVLWLDATETNTLVRDAQGHVTSWASLVRNSPTFDNSTFKSMTYKGSNRVVFTNDLNGGTGLVDAGKFGQQPYDRPFYAEDALNGKPGVRFGWKTDGMTPIYTQLLATNVITTLRSWFVVFKYTYPKNSAYGKYPVPFGWWTSADYMLSVYSDERLNKTLGATNVFANAELEQDNGVTYGQTKASGKNICLCPKDEAIVIAGRMKNANVLTGLAMGLASRAGHIDQGFSFCGEIGEIIAFERELTDREMQLVQRYLMEKWGVEAWPEANFAEARDILPTTTPVSVPAGATVDFEGTPQHLASLALAGDAEITDCALSADALAYAVPASGKTPCLTVGGDMDITETALTFTGAKPNSGRIVKTSGTLTGPFKSVTGAAADKIRYKANLAQFTTGLLLFLR